MHRFHNLRAADLHHGTAPHHHMYSSGCGMWVELFFCAYLLPELGWRNEVIRLQGMSEISSFTESQWSTKSSSIGCSSPSQTSQYKWRVSAPDFRHLKQSDFNFLCLVSTSSHLPKTYQYEHAEDARALQKKLIKLTGRPGPHVSAQQKFKQL